ncbi:DUF7344 domain-containing protein [Natronococcus occultus]|uniref:DUF7344 domain-containing protein n=1 Tax=Natronococcus occultus SP4 TaxID=694430 RepID=L0K1F4_9EURY|nr:hypothetical protein [Natronococcus occultus]AGB38801.1 hypothetical protein Natoc_3057 [Natronococcus occultus SP4]
MDSHETVALLADTERQHVLAALFDTDDHVTVDALAAQLAARRTRAGAPARDRAELRLVHDHLPRLAAHGVIEYDRARGEVVLEDAALEPFLTDLPHSQPLPLEP